MIEQTIPAAMTIADLIAAYARTPFGLAEGRVIPSSPNILGHQLC
jgi:hypothetical protein